MTDIDPNTDDLDFGDEGGIGPPPVDRPSVIPTQLFDGLAAHRPKAIEDARSPTRRRASPTEDDDPHPSAFGGPPLEISKDT